MKVGGLPRTIYEATLDQIRSQIPIQMQESILISASWCNYAICNCAIWTDRIAMA